MQCTVLQPKGTLRNSTLPTTVTGAPTPKDISAVLRRATEPQLVSQWQWEGKSILLFGYTAGKSGTENQHTVPPVTMGGSNVTAAPTLYGEAVVTAVTTDTGVPLAFPHPQWTLFVKDQVENEEGEEGEDSDEDNDNEESDGEEEGAVSEEEDDEEESETESISEEPEAVEEEEDAPPPVKVPRVTKRSNKKTPQWLTQAPVTMEDDHSQRATARQQIHHFLHAQLTAAEEQELERAIMEHALTEAVRLRVHPVWENREFSILYDIQLRRVISNLSVKSYVKNARLDVRRQEGEFTTAEVPAMAYSTLCPEMWKDLFEREMKREARMLEVDKSMATDMFKCTKCGKRQCTYYEMQTRSADEPMTIFVRCLNCGKRWRQ